MRGNVKSLSGIVHRICPDDDLEELKERFKDIRYHAFSNSSHGPYIGKYYSMTLLIPLADNMPIDEHRHRISSMEKRLKLEHWSTFPGRSFPVHSCQIGGLKEIWKNEGDLLDWRDFPRDDEGDEMAEGGSQGATQEADAFIKEELRKVFIGFIGNSTNLLLNAWKVFDPLIQDGTLGKFLVEENLLECVMEFGLDEEMILNILDIHNTRMFIENYRHNAI